MDKVARKKKETSKKMEKKKGIFPPRLISGQAYKEIKQEEREPKEEKNMVPFPLS